MKFLVHLFYFSCLALACTMSEKASNNFSNLQSEDNVDTIIPEKPSGENVSMVSQTDVLSGLNNSQSSIVPNNDTITPSPKNHEQQPNLDEVPSSSNNQKFEPHRGFVLVRDYIPDVIEDLRYFTTNNFMGEKVDGYQANVAIISKQAAIKLKEVADEFRGMGYVIKIYDAYRPQSAVDHFVRWAKGPNQKMKKEYYPTIEKRNLFPRYIASRSGHSKGSTIDLTICYKDSKEEVDMGSHFDYFGPPSHTSFLGAYPGGNVNKTHNKNRMLLKKVMESHGFTNYQNEWWHYTLNNQPYPKNFFNFPVTDH